MEERAKENFKDALPAFLAGYIKRFLEGQYDALFKTEAGKKIRSLDERLKYGIEFLFYSLTAFFDQKIAASSVIGRTLREVTLDFSSEFSKRMINGVRSEIAEAAKLPEEKTLAQTLLGFDDKSLVSLLNWLYGTAPEERTETMKFLGALSPQDLQKITELAPGDRERFIDLFISRRKMVELLTEKPPKEKPKSQIGKEVAEDVKNTLRDMTSSMAGVRAKLRKMREGRK